MSKELKEYIEKSLANGVSNEEIKKTLIDSGWSGKVIDKILSQYVGVDSHGLPVPAPRMQSHHIARDLFLYLLSLITLSIAAFALGALLFDIIDYYLPDPIVSKNDYYSSSNRDVSWAIAQLIIAFPIYTWISLWINRDINSNAEKRESLIRKLMIYLILIISALVALGDLMAVLTHFLEGEMTLRFFAQALVVMGIALIVFSYYLYEVRLDDLIVKGKDAFQQMVVGKFSLPRALWTISLVVSIVTLVSGFVLTGSPAYQRMERQDEERIRRIENLNREIESFTRHEKRLPTTLEELKQDRTSTLQPDDYVDPLTKIPFEYHEENAKQEYALCATFQTSNMEEKSTTYRTYRGYHSDGTNRWKHPSGHHCIYFKKPKTD